MKIKRLFAAILTAMMVVSCFSFTANAQETQTISDPLHIYTAVGSSDVFRSKEGLSKERLYDAENNLTYYHHELVDASKSIHYDSYGLGTITPNDGVIYFAADVRTNFATTPWVRVYGATVTGSTSNGGGDYKSSAYKADGKWERVVIKIENENLEKFNQLHIMFAGGYENANFTEEHYYDVSAMAFFADEYSAKNFDFAPCIAGGNGEEVVYLSANGKDIYSGLSADAPVATLTRANAVAKANASVDTYVILDNFKTAKDAEEIGVAGRTITVTGKTANVVFNYDANASGTDDDLVLAGPIVFENITIKDGSGDGMIQARGNKLVFGEGLTNKDDKTEFSAYSGTNNEFEVNSGNFARVLIGPISGTYKGNTTLTVNGGSIGTINLAHGWKSSPTAYGKFIVNINGGNVGGITLNSNGAVAATQYKGLRYYTINGGSVDAIVTTESSTYGDSASANPAREGVTVFEINAVNAVKGNISLGNNIDDKTPEEDKATRVIIFNNGTMATYAGQVTDTKAKTIDVTGGYLKADVSYDASTYAATLNGFTYEANSDDYDSVRVGTTVLKLADLENDLIPASLFADGTTTVGFFESEADLFEDLYISASGDDANRGNSPAAPVKTFKRAREIMDAEGSIVDTVYIMGTVAVGADDKTNGKSIGFGTAGRKITYLGYTDDNVADIIDCSAYCAYLMGDVEMDNFTFQQQTTWDGKLTLENHDITVGANMKFAGITSGNLTLGSGTATVLANFYYAAGGNNSGNIPSPMLNTITVKGGTIDKVMPGIYSGSWTFKGDVTVNLEGNTVINTLSAHGQGYDNVIKTYGAIRVNLKDNAKIGTITANATGGGSGKGSIGSYSGLREITLDGGSITKINTTGRHSSGIGTAEKREALWVITANKGSVSEIVKEHTNDNENSKVYAIFNDGVEPGTTSGPVTVLNVKGGKVAADTTVSADYASATLNKFTYTANASSDADAIKITAGETSTTYELADLNGEISLDKITEGAVNTIEFVVKDELAHIAAYRAAGYEIVYLTDVISTPVKEKTAEGKKVVFALKKDINLTGSLTLSHNGGTFVITSAGGAINMGTNSVTFGTDKNADIILDNVAFNKGNGERGLNAFGNNLTLTETFTTTSTDANALYVNATADGGSGTSNGNTLTIETPSKVLVRCSGWSGNFTNGDVNYVFGKNANAYLVVAGKVGKEGIQAQLKGNATVTVKDNANLTKIVLAEGYSYMTGNLAITIKDNANVGEISIGKEVGGNAYIDIQDGTVGPITVTSGVVKGKSVIKANTDKATVGAITGASYAVKYNGNLGGVAYSADYASVVLTPNDSVKYVRLTNGDTVKEYDVEGNEVDLLEDLTFALAEGVTTVEFLTEGTLAPTTANAVFNANGGAWGEETTKTVVTTIGEVPVAPEAPAKEGFTFKGWTPELAAITAAGATYTAVWEANAPTTATLKFYDGDTLFVEKTVAIGATEDVLPVWSDKGLENAATNDTFARPVKPGYYLKGWAAQGSTDVLVAGEFAATQDASYYAVWEEADMIADGEVTITLVSDIANSPIPADATVFKTTKNGDKYEGAFAQNYNADGTVYTTVNSALAVPGLAKDTEGSTGKTTTSSYYGTSGNVTSVLFPEGVVSTWYKWNDGKYLGFETPITGEDINVAYVINASPSASTKRGFYLEAGDVAGTLNLATVKEGTADFVVSFKADLAEGDIIKYAAPADFDNSTIKAAQILAVYVWEDAPVAPTTANATFNANGGAWGEETTKTVVTTIGEVPVAPEAPAKAGFTFKGWSPELTAITAEGATYTAVWEALVVNEPVKMFAANTFTHFYTASGSNMSVTTGTDAETRYVYKRYAFKDGTAPATPAETYCDSYANLGMTVENGLVYYVVIMRTNQTGTPNIRPLQGTGIGDRYYASAPLKADGTWERVVIKMEKAGLKDFKQMHMRLLGEVQTDKIRADFYYDIAGYAFFGDEYSANNYDFTPYIIGYEEANAVYVNATAGDDANHGRTSKFAVKTLSKAETLLKTEGLDTLYVIGNGQLNSDAITFGVAGKTIKVRGYNGSSDVFDVSAGHLRHTGSVDYDNVTIKIKDGDGRFMAQGNDITIGTGVVTNARLSQFYYGGNKLETAADSTITLKAGTWGSVHVGNWTDGSYYGTSTIVIDGATVGSVKFGHGSGTKQTFNGTGKVILNSGTIEAFNLDSATDAAVNSYNGLRYFTLNGGKVTGNMTITSKDSNKDGSKTSTATGVTVIEINAPGILEGSITKGKADDPDAKRIVIYNNDSYVEGKVTDADAIVIKAIGAKLHADVTVANDFVTTTHNGYTYELPEGSAANAVKVGEETMLLEDLNGVIPASKFVAGVNTAEFTTVSVVTSANAIFDANGGKFADGAATVTVETKIDETPVAPAAPTKDGYTFKGWTPELTAITSAGATYTAVWEATVRTFENAVYLGDAGADTNDGLTPATLVKTLKRAQEVVLANEDIDTIVVVGTYSKSNESASSTNDFLKGANRKITITGQTVESVFDMKYGSSDSHLRLGNDIEFNNLEINASSGDGGIMSMGYELTFGENLTVNGQKIGFLHYNNQLKDNGIINIKSGTFGRVDLGVQSGQTYRGTSTINVYGGEVGAIRNGHGWKGNQAVYGINNVNVNGGSVGYINLGSSADTAVTNYSGLRYFTINDGTVGDITITGSSVSKVYDTDKSQTASVRAGVTVVEYNGGTIGKIQVGTNKQTGAADPDDATRVVILNNNMTANVTDTGAIVVKAIGGKLHAATNAQETYPADRTNIDSNWGKAIVLKGFTYELPADSTANAVKIDGGEAILLENYTNDIITGITTAGEHTVEFVTVEEEVEYAIVKFVVNGTETEAEYQVGAAVTFPAVTTVPAPTKDAYYTFKAWNDGTADVDATYTAPAGGATLTATFNEIAMPESAYKNYVAADLGVVNNVAGVFTRENATIDGVEAVKIIPGSEGNATTTSINIEGSGRYPLNYSTGANSTVLNPAIYEYAVYRYYYVPGVNTETRKFNVWYQKHPWENTTLVAADMLSVDMEAGKWTYVVDKMDRADGKTPDLSIQFHIRPMNEVKASALAANGEYVYIDSMYLFKSEPTVATVTFKGEDGAVLYAIDALNSEAVRFNGTAPEKADHEFLGWAVEGTTDVVDEFTFAEDTTLVPVFKSTIVEPAEYKTYGVYDEAAGTYTVELKITNVKAHMGSFGFVLPGLVEVIPAEGVTLFSEIGTAVSPIFAKGDDYYANTWAIEEAPGYIDATNEEVLIATFVLNATASFPDKFLEYVVSADADPKYFNGTNYLVAPYTNGLDTDKIAVVYTAHKDDIIEAVVEADYEYKTYGNYNPVTGDYTIKVAYKGGKVNAGAFGIAFNSDYMTFDPDASNALVLAEGIANYLGIELAMSEDGVAFVWDGSANDADGYIDATEEVVIATIAAKMTEDQRAAYEAAGTPAFELLDIADVEDAEKYVDAEGNYLVALYVDGLEVTRVATAYTTHADTELEITTADVKVIVTFDDKDGETVSNIGYIWKDLDEPVVIDDIGNTEATLEYVFKDAKVGDTIVIKVAKNGYVTALEEVTVSAAGNVVEITVLGGDIKESTTAICGDGTVDLSDFIRVVRAFDSAATDEYKSTVDINEDGAVNVTDLGIVKANFGTVSGSNLK